MPIARGDRVTIHTEHGPTITGDVLRITQEAEGDTPRGKTSWVLEVWEDSTEE